MIHSALQFDITIWGNPEIIQVMRPCLSIETYGDLGIPRDLRIPLFLWRVSHANIHSIRGFSHSSSISSQIFLFSSQLFRAIPALKTPQKNWLVVSTPQKNMKVSWDDDIPNIWGKIKIYVPNHQPEKVTCFPHQQPITWCAPTPTPPIPARAGCQHRAASGGGCWSRWRGACGEDLWKPRETCSMP